MRKILILTTCLLTGLSASNNDNSEGSNPYKRAANTNLTEVGQGSISLTAHMHQQGDTHTYSSSLTQEPRFTLSRLDFLENMDVEVLGVISAYAVSMADFPQSANELNSNQLIKEIRSFSNKCLLNTIRISKGIDDGSFDQLTEELSLHTGLRVLELDNIFNVKQKFGRIRVKNIT